jgi:ribose transport system ATP-binding protein
MLEEHALEMRGVGMRFGDVWVLHDVDYVVPAGSISGLVGHNGAGKSTLMKIAQGAYAPVTGELLIGGQALTHAQPSEARRLGVGMVFQEQSLISTLSGLDNIFLNDEHLNALRLVSKRRETAEAEELCTRLGISPDVLERPVSDMSAVERELVEIAKAMRLARKVLILDEPTAPLSHREIETLFGVIRSVAATGTAVVLITHHLAEVFAVCDRVTVLREGTVTMSVPTAQTNMTSVVEAMLGAQSLVAGAALGRAVSKRQSERAFEAIDLKVGEKLRSGVSFEIYRGEIVGVAGLAGSGRTTLLRALFGDFRLANGAMKLHGATYRPRGPIEAIRKGVFLIPEDRHAFGLLNDHPIVENIALPVLRRLRRHSFFSNTRAHRLAERLMKVLSVRARAPEQVVGELSGGNQQKIVLAKALAADAELLLLDEPTFGVDIGSSMELIRHVRQMVEGGKAALWVTSDLQELLEVSDRILVLADGTIRTVISAGEPGFDEASLIRKMQRRRTPAPDEAPA